MKIIIDTAGPVQLTLDTGETLDLMVTEELSSLVRAITEYAGSHRPMTPTERTLDFVAQSADGTALLEMADIFPAHQIEGQFQKHGSIWRFNGELYRMIAKENGRPKDIVTQADWLPPNVPSIYLRIDPPGVIPKWRQPQGKHDAYKMGDQAYHPTPDKIWEVDKVDANGFNVWEPGVYGWTLTEE